MNPAILVLGGYGNFGGRIVKALARDPDLIIHVAGRNRSSAEAFCAAVALSNLRPVVLDAEQDFAAALGKIAPALVIHTSGPFQGQSYAVAEACITRGVHYIDLADGRDFVVNFATLSPAACANGVTAITGASTVPCLSSAVLNYMQPYFSEILSIDYGISPGAASLPGLATLRGILSYVGRPFMTLQDGIMKPVFGWQNPVRRNIPRLGARIFANCDIPDLKLLPEFYPCLRTIRFRAGIEIGLFDYALCFASYLVRLGLVSDLAAYAGPLLKIARALSFLGTANGGMYFTATGKGHDWLTKTMTWSLVARHGDGPQIPCIPAILLARRLMKGDGVERGAFTALGLVTLQDYLDELREFDVSSTFA